MSKFEDHLWREFMREHGHALAQMSTPTAKHVGRGPRLVAGISVGLAGVGVAVALVLGAASTSPAFAVTRNHDGTVTISIQRASGIAGANARLNQLGVRAKVMQQVPADYRCTSWVAQQGQGAPTAATSSSAPAPAPAHWTIDPRKVPAGRTLALTPPPPPPGDNSSNSGNSGNSTGSSSGGQVWSCGTEGQGASSPPPAPVGDNSGNSGNN